MADFAQILIRAKDDTKGAFDSAARNMRGLEAGAAKLRSVMGAIGIGAGLSAAGFAAFAKSSIDAADNLNDMSQKLGVSVKDLASFKLAAEQSGTSLEGVGNGIARLSRSIGEAEGGNKQLAKALQDLSITARDPKEAFFQLADAVKRIDDPARRAALLSQVLGKSYQELIPLLAQGGDELRKSARASESFADAMARLAPDADRFNDELAALKINAAGAAGELLSKLVPGLADTATRVRELLDDDKGIQALVRAFAGLGKIPFDVIFGDIKPVATATERIRELQVELGELQRKKDSGNGLLLQKLFGTPEELDRQIAVIKNQIAVLQKFGDQIYKPKAAAAAATTTGGVDLSAAVGGGKKFDKSELIASDIAAAWKEADAELKRYAEDRDFVLEGDLERDNAINEVAQQWAEAGRVLTEEMMTPLEKANIEFTRLDELLERGVITWETYSRAVFKTQEELEKIPPEIKEINGLAKDLGLTFSSAFEDAIVGGEGLSDVLKGLEQDILRIMTRKLVTEPLGNALTGMIGGLVGGLFGGGGAAASPSFGSIAFGFANGGIMTSAGPLPLNKYATGGIASSPQMAIFGEGSKPEAYVPLPDGKRIPVAMSGGGSTVVNMNISTPDANSFRASKGQITADMTRALQRGRRYL